MFIQIILGVVQGIFEWIPISSQGMTALVAKFLTNEFNPIEIALLLHLGTLLAAVIYFRKDWKEVILLKNRKLLHFLLIATVISLIIGFPLYKFVKHMALGSGLLLIMGFGLLVTAYFHKSKKQFKISQGKLTWLVGVLQGLSIIPGLSRSGATIFGLSLGDLEPKEILRMSYMLSVPVGLAANFYLFLENPGLIAQGWIGLITSFIVGIFSLHLLIRVSEKINFFKFALVFAGLCFLGVIVGLIL